MVVTLDLSIMYDNIRMAFQVTDSVQDSTVISRTQRLQGRMSLVSMFFGHQGIRTECKQGNMSSNASPMTIEQTFVDFLLRLPLLPSSPSVSLRKGKEL